MTVGTRTKEVAIGEKRRQILGMFKRYNWQGLEAYRKRRGIIKDVLIYHVKNPENNDLSPISQYKSDLIFNFEL